MVRYSDLCACKNDMIHALKKVKKVQYATEGQYEEFGTFDLKITIVIEKELHLNFFFVYEDGKEIKCRIGSSWFRVNEGYESYDVVHDLEKNIEEIYRLYQIFEKDLKEWIMKQPELRLQSLFTPVLRKRRSIKRIENCWRETNDRV